MSNADPKWYMLGGLLLLLVAIVAARMVTLREYSNEEVRAICLEVYQQYKGLREKAAGDIEWQSFEVSALDRLNSIAADIESVSSEKSPVAWRFYQTAKYDLPEIIRSRKETSKAGKLHSRVIAALAVPLPSKSLPHSSSQSEVANEGDANGLWDPISIALVIFDSALLVGVVIYWKRCNR